MYNTIISAHEKGAREGDSVVAGDIVGTADIINAKMQPKMRTSRIDDVYHWATFNINSWRSYSGRLQDVSTLPSWPVGGEQWQLATQILGKLRVADLQQADSSVYHHASCRFCFEVGQT